MNADEMAPGTTVWARIIKKGAAIPATILSTEPAPDGGQLCMLELEIEDPFHSNKTIRQAYKKAVHSSLLSLRKPAEETQREASTPKGDNQDDPYTHAAESEQENTRAEPHQPEPAKETSRRDELAIRDLRFHLGEGERCFTRLAARLAEIEAYHPVIGSLIQDAEHMRDSYLYVLYGERARQTAKEEQKAEPPEAAWTRYSQGDLRRHHDERRAWLTNWAAAHNYPALPYRTHWRGKGYLAYTVPQGSKGWKNFLAHAWPYLIYGAFVEAYAPGQIGHYLTEAAERGDIQLDGDPQTPTQLRQSWEEQMGQADLTHYSRETMIFQGPHDQARRAWLSHFAQEHRYPAFWFTLYHKYSGYYQAGVPKGEEGWGNFLNKAVQYDIYCCFIEVYTPGQLEHFLQDAEQRGEIKLTDDLLWKPSNNHSKRR